MLTANKLLANSFISETVGEGDPDNDNANFTLRFQSGHVYKGSFVDGFMSGQGELSWVDGVVYSGDFERNSITGYGSYTW